MKRLPLMWLPAALLVGLLGACGTSNAPGGVASPTTGSRAQTPPQTSTAKPTQARPDQPRVEPTVALPPKDSSAEPEVIAAQRPRVKPAPGTTRRSELVGGLNSFAFDLYHTVDKQDANLIYSPYSIAMAFSMVYAGARGQTEAQMRDVLKFLPQRSHHPAANSLERHMASLGAKARPAGEQRVDAFQLRSANAVWGQRGYPFLDAFLATLAEQYGAGVRSVGFKSNPEGARKAVNDWVADQTEERIRDILPQGSIDPTTRLVLANAIYFKAAWLYPFDRGGTKDRPFTLLDGSKVSVPMMSQGVARVPYTEGDGYQAVVLPYTGDTVDMVVILPRPGRFENIEASMSADFLEGVRRTSETRDVTMTMPRFDFESELDLIGILPGMGMPDPFGQGVADFSGIAGDRSLFISTALHRATIAVDEKGTEATAATVIGMTTSAMETANLTIDHPFIFAIVEHETGAILFLGRVMNPAG